MLHYSRAEKKIHSDDLEGGYNVGISARRNSI